MYMYMCPTQERLSLRYTARIWYLPRHYGLLFAHGSLAFLRELALVEGSFQNSLPPLLSSSFVLEVEDYSIRPQARTDRHLDTLRVERIESDEGPVSQDIHCDYCTCSCMDRSFNRQPRATDFDRLGFITIHYNLLI